jgi:hypothetical protein
MQADSAYTPRTSTAQAIQSDFFVATHPLPNVDRQCRGYDRHTRGHAAQMSADGEHTPIGEILIFPNGASAPGHDGYIVVGSETSLYPEH